VARKTLIFGNGLGMALQSDFFSLDNAIGATWDDPEVLDDAVKALVSCCLPGEADRPHEESELDTLQLVVSACEFLGRTGAGQISWLTDDGLRFPLAVRTFLYRTALHFHLQDFRLPDGFTTALASFLHETKSHIATLNYDNLIYQSMIEAQVLRGYSGVLIDGFWGSGFQEGNLARFNPDRLGYYLHLHGSPLFIDRDDVTIKLRQADVEAGDSIGSHIVLTHVEHKQTVIASSPLLTSYWKHLEVAFSESASGVILFGYGGEDEHLNVMLRAKQEMPITVVEWNGAGSHIGRGRYWLEKMGRSVTLVQLDNVLDYRDWAA
jgi:hypothetical protein